MDKHIHKNELQYPEFPGNSGENKEVKTPGITIQDALNSMLIGQRVQVNPDTMVDRVPGGWIYHLQRQMAKKQADGSTDPVAGSLALTSTFVAYPWPGSPDSPLLSPEDQAGIDDGTIQP
jgi:hypothetical protein